MGASNRWLILTAVLLALGVGWGAIRALTSGPELNQQELDTAFLAALRFEKVPELPNGNPVGTARALCRWYAVANTSSAERGAAQLMSEYPMLTRREAVAFNDAATAAYCPQHGRTP